MIDYLQEVSIGKCEEEAKKASRTGIAHPPGKRSKPIELAMLGCREEQLTWPGHRHTISAGSEQKRPKGGDILRGLAAKVLETIDSRWLASSRKGS